MSKDKSGSGDDGSGEAMGRDCRDVRGDCPKSVIQNQFEVRRTAIRIQLELPLTIFRADSGCDMEAHTGAEPLQGLRSLEVIH